LPIELASLGARTPFITKTPSNAVRFAFPATGVGFGKGLGLAAAAAGSAVFVAASVVALFFATGESLEPANRGDTHTADNRKLQDHLLKLITELFS
jgi:hypothetical protein